MAMTYLAQTKGDRIQRPPAIAQQVRNSGWIEVLIAAAEDNESLTAFPLPHPSAPASGFTTQVDDKDGLHISEEIRRQVSLDGQSVMVRIVGGGVQIYLRKTFKPHGVWPF